MDVASVALVRAKDTMSGFRKLIVLAAACLGLTGCAAITNPVADGIPVGRLRPELLAPSKEDQLDIPYLLLRRHPPDVYRVAAGDVLGIVIDNVLGDSKVLVPVKQTDTNENTPPALGYPIPVREDGTINVPQVPPIHVEGKSIAEIERLLKDVYTGKAGTPRREIVKEAQWSAIVTLYHKRTYRILVIRQDSGGNSTSVSSNTIFGSTTVVNSPKRGSGQQLELPNGENDVLTALAKTGGMPGTDAINEVVIERSRPEPVSADKANDPNVAKTAEGKYIKYVKQYIRIPLRIRQGNDFPFTEQDIILQNGDVVFIGQRDADVYYTAGLLGAGQYVLPRDSDLDVIQAICLVRGPLINGAFSGNNLAGSVVAAGLGLPNPSRLTILRKTANRGEIRIKVDLNLAFHDIKQRPLVQAGDTLVLQQSPAEAVMTYLTQMIKIDTVIHALKTPTVTSDVNTITP